MKIIFLVSLLSILFPITYKRKNLPVNFATKITMHDCIYRGFHQTKKIGLFEINYIKNSPADCINPNYPTIHIMAHVDNNAWLHVVHTDAVDPHTGNSNWIFIDAPENIFPFYTLSENFYDAPHWNSSLFAKPLSYWKGHAYPVTVDYERKIIHFSEGIEWGFRWLIFRFSPSFIEPQIISIQDRLVDQKLLQAALPNFTFRP